MILSYNSFVLAKGNKCGDIRDKTEILFVMQINKLVRKIFTRELAFNKMQK